MPSSSQNVITWARLIQAAFFININVRAVLSIKLQKFEVDAYPGMHPHVKTLHPPEVSPQIAWAAAHQVAITICGESAKESVGFPTSVAVDGIIKQYMVSPRFTFEGTGLEKPTRTFELGTVNWCGGEQSVQNAVRLLFEQSKSHLTWLCEEIWSDHINNPLLTSEVDAIDVQDLETLMESVLGATRSYHSFQRLIAGVSHAIAFESFGFYGSDHRKPNFEQLRVVQTYFEELALAIFFKYKMPEPPGTTQPA